MADFLINKDTNEALSLQEFVGGSISGAGTLNYIPKFTGPASIGDSIIYEDPSGLIGINNTAPNSLLHIGNEVVLGEYVPGGTAPMFTIPKNLFSVASATSPGEQVTGGFISAQTNYITNATTVGLIVSTYSNGAFNSASNTKGIFSLVELDMDSGGGLVDGCEGLSIWIRNMGTGSADAIRGINVAVTEDSTGSNTLAYGVYVGLIEATTAWGFFQDSPEDNHFRGNFKIGLGPANNRTPLEALHIADQKDIAISLEQPSHSIIELVTGGAVYTAGNNLQYRVSVLDHKGGEVLSNPSNIILSGANNSVQISWSAIPGAISYRIYRNLNGGGFNDYIEVLDGSVLIVDTGLLTYVPGTLPTVNDGYIHHLSSDNTDDSYIGTNLRVRDDFKVGSDIFKDDPTNPNGTLRIWEQGTGGIQLANPSITPDPIGEHSLDFQLTRISSSQVAAGDYCFIFGAGNTIDPSSIGCSIIGGLLCSAEGLFNSIFGGNINNITSSGYGNTIVGGDSNYITAGNRNFVAGSTNTVTGSNTSTFGFTNNNSGIFSHAEGSNNIVSGQSSHVEGNFNNCSGNFSHAEGAYCTASGNYAHVGGSSCTASGNYSHVSGLGSNASGLGGFSHGNSCNAGSDFDIAFNTYCVATGKNGLAHGLNSYGHLKTQYAHGNANVQAQNQYSRVILHRNTTDATPTLLTLTGDEIGSSTDYKFYFASLNRTLGVKASIVARNSGGTKHLYIIRDFIIEYTTPSIPTIIGSVATTLDITNTTWSVSIAPETVIGGLDVTVTGEVGEDIEWTCVLEFVETGKN